MLLNFTDLVNKYAFKSTGVILCGAHFGEEYDEFVKNGINRMAFIEPCKKAFSVLVDKFGSDEKVKLFNVACGDYEGESIMYTGDETVNQGMSNSLLKPAKHLILHPTVKFPDTETVYVVEMDSLDLAGIGFDLLVMDCQGFEGRVIKGATETLKHINWVYSEINFDEVYEDNTKSEELDMLLSDFQRVETGTKVGGMWADCFYVRRSLLNNL